MEQRLALASIWGFEPIGIREVSEEIKTATSQPDCHLEYLKLYDIISIEGSVDYYTKQIAGIVSDTISGNEYKDLLDEPRIYQLDMTSSLQSLSNEDEMNLSLEDGCELIPTSSIHITKLWLSPNGGVGCFSFESRKLLASIADLTSTEITMLDDTNGIQVTGTSEVDVDDALAKLTRVEKPLACVHRPITTNILVAPEDEALRYRLVKYNTLNPIAERRVLPDPTLDPHLDPSEMYVSVQYSIDGETHALKLPPNLANPPHLFYDPGKSRIWNDFTFQPLGSDEGYDTVYELAESANPRTNAMTVAVPPSLHPYLTVEKAKQVNQWVVEGARVEKDIPEQESVAPGINQTPSTQGPAPTLQAPVPRTPARVQRNRSEATEPQRLAGVKVRRVAPASIKQKAQAAPSLPETRPASTKTLPMAEPRSPKPASSGLEGNDLSPRRRWVMQYDVKNGGQGLQSLKMEAKAPNSQSQARAQARSSEDNRSIISSKFDSTKYGLAKSSPQRAFGRRGNLSTGPAALRKAARQNQLIDIDIPVSNTTSTQVVSFDQPALLPVASSSCGSGSDTTILLDKNTSDLAGLTIGASNLLDSSDSWSGLETASWRSSNLISQDKRLNALRQSYNAAAVQVLPTADEKPNIAASRSQANEAWVKAMVTDLERAQRSEKESSSEVTSREFHNTRHRTPKSAITAESKAEAKARRQATLEDSWGISKPKNKPIRSPGGPEPAASVTVQALVVPKPDPVKDEGIQRQVKNIYDAIIPILDLAVCFPGAKNVEMQFGLILVPLLPKSYRQENLTADAWTKLFRPQSGLSAPTTKFIKRLTTSGADIDHIVDIRTSKADGKLRLFEQDYADYSVSYEFHFRTRSNQLYMVVIDENGRYSVREPGKKLGGVTFHFPANTWDANMSVNQVTGFVGDSNPDIEQIAQHLAKSIWVEPDRNLICIYTRLPTEMENKVTLEKVYMRRWTRHRHLQRDEAAARIAREQASATVTTSPDKALNEDDINTTSHIFLQITEVQDLLLGKHYTEPEVKRARATAPAEMVNNGRLWYEVSLVSPAIDSLLNSNADLEIGEPTTDWRGIDLFGRDAAALIGDTTTNEGKTEDETPSAVAKDIGHAGLGDMLRLARTVIQRIDAVGYWNTRPGMDVPLEPLTTTTASFRSSARARGVVGMSYGGDDDDSQSSEETLGARVDSKGIVRYPAQVDIFSPQEYW
ncbi:hypothetical protein ASPACDRAFT_122002 [Aspergillus aculeatus ATCC 16872]|uniref:Uncharacterized protein n=1 Tax=Aspergillus aculeatus (strain ATCC 16872 / CBS 172.66 / WB 5094) TaxID=690307 RepID=A0A1L9WQ13_ASPA1|nr:uncharacterized protein ASPACDRAFT_122002 [Aspergillus aculeatus ATCC 16872]OJJ98230.1 hypothetical protein ASPACDRAFT_122002 [Aspergillus aculeatus ATCC 16872]